MYYITRLEYFSVADNPRGISLILKLDAKRPSWIPAEPDSEAVFFSGRIRWNTSSQQSW